MEDGYVIDRPNRAKASSKTTRAIVVVLMLVSAGLMSLIVFGGWGGLQGSKFNQVVYILLYLVIAYFIGRWSRGLLPVAAALAIILLIFAAISGPEWFDRDKTGFSTPDTIFGTTGLESAVLGLLTYLLIPVQLLLIAFSAQGFRQDWHIEVEVPRSRAQWSGAAPRRISTRPGARRGTTTGGIRG